MMPSPQHDGPRPHPTRLHPHTQNARVIACTWNTLLALPRSWTARLLTAALLITGVALADGCAIRTRAAQERAATVEPLDDAGWPARCTDGLHEWAGAVPPTLDVLMPGYAQDEDGDWLETRQRQPWLEVVRAEPHGQGVVLEVDWLRGPFNRTEPGLSRTYLRVQSWQHAVDATPTGTFDIRDGLPGTALTITSPDAPPIRGLAITAGGGTSWDNRVRDRLVARGWANMHLGSTHVVDAERRREFIFPADAPLDEIAEEVAGEIDQALADSAYAVEAGLSHLAAHQPNLVDGPIVMIGFSMGALILPTAAARVHDEIDAIVLVCGAANLLSAALETAQDDEGWLDIAIATAADRASHPTRAQCEALGEAYLRHSRLDPWRIAPALRDIPTLLLHGMFDRVVPADGGDLLWQRLGRPARWSYPLGHGGTFWMLGMECGRLVDWIEAAAPAAVAAPPTTPTAAIHR